MECTSYRVTAPRSGDRLHTCDDTHASCIRWHTAMGCRSAIAADGALLEYLPRRSRRDDFSNLDSQIPWYLVFAFAL